MPSIIRNMFQSEKLKTQQNILDIVNAGVPTAGTSGTGAGFCGPGSRCIDYSNSNIYINTGTRLSPTWTLVPNALTFGTGITGATMLQRTSGSISAADIIGTAAGQFGHANGYPLLAAQGAHNVIELVSAEVHFQRATAAYTAGGNITINWSAGGAALTGLVSAANSLGNAAAKSWVFYPLTTAAILNVENGGLNLVSSAAFTNPGTAAGLIAWVLYYRVHATGF